MKKADATAVELAALRQQVEQLSRQVEALTASLAMRTVSAPAAPASVEQPERIPWLVITAAVAHLIKEPHRIVSLQASGFPPINLWSIEGRRAVFHSHQVR